MSSTHTPGPWTAVQGQGAHHRDVYIRAGERIEGGWPAVARCCSSRVGSFATVQANGRLIAAAPDLVVELEKCKATFERLAEAGASRGVCAGAIASIEATVLKARSHQ